MNEAQFLQIKMINDKLVWLFENEFKQHLHVLFQSLISEFSLLDPYKNIQKQILQKKKMKVRIYQHNYIDEWASLRNLLVILFLQNV